MSWSDGSYWVAVQVRPNHERVAASHLDLRECEYFLPLYQSVRQWSDRKKELQLPLFPSYLFCRYSKSMRSAILLNPSVVRILGCNGEPEAVSDSEVEAIQRIVAAGLDCRPTEYIRTGDRVRLGSGPLEGLEGLVTDTKEGKSRFVVSVTMLNRSVAVEVDARWLKVIHAAAARPAGAPEAMKRGRAAVAGQGGWF